jgi:hypothetical protein
MRCTTCDAFVTADFVRVFGTNDGRVFACPNCASMTSVADGAAVDPSAEDRRQGDAP